MTGVRVQCPKALTRHLGVAVVVVAVAASAVAVVAAAAAASGEPKLRPWLPTHPTGEPCAGPSLPDCWPASSCAISLSIWPIICCTRFVSLLLAFDSSTSCSSPVLESSFLISCKS